MKGRVWTAWAATGALVLACSAAQAATVQAKTAAEFLKAIGPDTTIELTAEAYNLSEVPEMEHDYVNWVAHSPGGGMNIVINDVRGLKIIGKGRVAPRITVEASDVFVLSFVNCVGVLMENLVMGHDTEEACKDGVLSIYGSTDVSVSRCDLFGSGSEGVRLENSMGFVMDHSIIRECTVSIMSIIGAKNAVFADCKFFNNKANSGLVFRQSEDIRFTDCIVMNNTMDSPIFDLEGTVGVKLLRGHVTGNIATQLTNSNWGISFEGTERTRAIVGEGEVKV